MSMCQWIINDISEEDILKYSREWNLPEVCAAILYFRGFKDNHEVEKFLNYSNLMNPFEFKDMDKAVKILRQSIKNNEKICIYGDYDADGITATAILYYYLKNKNVDVIYYIPKRHEEGYGLNIQAIRKLHNMGVNLLITVDNGISAYDEIVLAKSLEIKVIVTDHHKLPEKLPPADAIINPCRQEKWDTKYENFSGVAVAYELLKALEDKLDNLYLDFVTIGTIGDCIPMFGQARSMIKNGLESIVNSKIKGVKILLESVGLKNKAVDSIDLAFKVVPRVNVSGRLFDADLAFNLLVNDDENTCKEICKKLDALNKSRKVIENEIVQSVEKDLMLHPYKKYENIIISKGNGWHYGVVGIAASRITRKYGKPCILISQFENEARGSCRSIEGFSIYEVILFASKYLDRFGGHDMAAGINLKAENIELFSNLVLKKSREYNFNFPKLMVDYKIEEKSFSKNLLYELEYLKPFGNANEEPIFCLIKLKLKKIQPIANQTHLKLLFYGKEKTFEMLYFYKNKSEFLYNEGDTLDVAFTIHEDSYKKQGGIVSYIVDIKNSFVEMHEVIESKRIFEKFGRQERLCDDEINNLLPDKKDFAIVYRYLVKNNRKRQRVDILSYNAFGNSNFCGKIYIILSVFEEMGLIDIYWYADEFVSMVKKVSGKIDLNDSKILISLKNMRKEDEIGK